MQVMTLSDIPSMLGVLFVSALLFMLVQSRYRRWEVRVMLVSMAAHVIFAVYKLWLTVEVYGGGDMLNFHHRGLEIAQLLRMDFFSVAPEVVKMLLQLDFQLSLSYPARATSTASLQALTGMVVFVVGDSLIGVCLAYSMAAFFGKIVLYEMFRSTLHARYHKGVAVAALLVPSVIMWSAGIIKEGVAMIGVGVSVLSFSRLLERVTPAEVLRLILGALTIALFKAYILMVLVIAGGVWLYWRRAARRGQVQVRPFYLLLGLALSVGGVLGLGELFPRFSLENILEETSQAQFYGSRARGGSSYSLGDYTNRSLAGQLVNAPLALFTALYRPLIFEARNPQMLLSSLETTLLFGATARVLWKRSWRQVLRRVMGDPLLMFCLIFSLIIGVMTGLTSSNLGTLNRYRMPLMPFFVALVYLVSAKSWIPSLKRAERVGRGRRARAGCIHSANSASPLYPIR